MKRFNDRNGEYINARHMIHEVLSGYNLVPEIECPDIKNPHLRIFPREDLITKWNDLFKNNGRQKVGLFISNTSSARQWPKEKWKALAKKLQYLAI